MMLILDAFGLALAVTLAFAVWGPDIWRWIAARLERFPPKWIPVRRRKERQLKNPERAFDSMEMKRALGMRPPVEGPPRRFGFD
jgi:hypothetical protein